MAEHHLKTDWHYFRQVWAGEKTFEVRLHDRAFQVGDVLVLKEITGNDSPGRTLKRRITNVFPGGQYGLDRYFCILSIKKLHWYSWR
jgi:ASC-1-like (ASCH) protein